LRPLADDWCRHAVKGLRVRTAGRVVCPLRTAAEARLVPPQPPTVISPSCIVIVLLVVAEGEAASEGVLATTV
jgi:hypothetical protein